MLHQSFKGIKVLDLSRIMAGPWCTQNLADLGANVLKVENTTTGDDTRSWGPTHRYGADAEDSFSAYFISANRGKRSLSIDFGTPRGADIVRRLASGADVVVENFKSGTLGRYGLDYPALAEGNPGLVYISITGFGQTGPMSSKPGYDYVFQGMGGLMSYTGPQDGEAGAMPLRTGVAVVDLMTGMYASTAVLAALMERHTTGKGQQVDLALLDVSVAFNANQGSNYLVSGQVPRRSGNAHPNCAPYEVFAVEDGFLILAIGNDNQFRQFCQAAGSDLLAGDPRFSTNNGRIENLAALRPVIAELMARRSKSTWATLLDSAGVPWGPTNNLQEVFENPQVSHRQMLVTVQHPEHGTVPMVRNPLVNAQATAASLPPPARGEHTFSVLRELGMSPEEIDSLVAAGVVTQATEKSVHS